MEPKELQNYANHAKLDPPFHFFLVPVAAINVIIAVVYLVRFPRLGSGWIRVEERLRLSQVLSQPLCARIGELSDKQLVGLRFASDGELPALVQRALDEKLSLVDIKKSVTSWRGDYSRI